METDTDTSGAQPVRMAGGARYSLDKLRSGFEDMWRWWWLELLEMVPAHWRLWAVPRLRVEASATGLLVFKKHQQEPIDRIELNDSSFVTPSLEGPSTRCELVLSSDLGLATPITLPVAAAANLRSVVAFSMDRYTPFREDEVYYDVRITHRDRRNSKFELMLYAVPRATLDRLQQHLAAAGLTAASVDIMDGQQETPVRAGINLIAAANGHASALRARLNGALAVMAILLFMAALLIPVYQRQQTISALEQELEALRTPVLDAERLRKDVNRRSDTLRIIMERRNTTPPVLELLRELTRLTPDEAWAGQIEIRNGRLRITGEASAGSELMQALTTSSHFSDPRFEAPLTQNPKSGRERFVISLAIKERVDER